MPLILLLALLVFSTACGGEDEAPYIDPIWLSLAPEVKPSTEAADAYDVTATIIGNGSGALSVDCQFWRVDGAVKYLEMIQSQEDNIPDDSTFRCRWRPGAFTVLQDGMEADTTNRIHMRPNGSIVLRLAGQTQDEKKVAIEFAATGDEISQTGGFRSFQYIDMASQLMGDYSFGANAKWKPAEVVLNSDGDTQLYSGSAEFDPTKPVTAKFQKQLATTKYEVRMIIVRALDTKVISTTLDVAPR